MPTSIIIEFLGPSFDNIFVPVVYLGGSNDIYYVFSSENIGLSFRNVYIIFDFYFSVSF